MVELLNKQRQKIAILEKAYNVTESLNLNSLDFLEFKLPLNDIKNNQIEYRNLVKFNNHTYRVMTKDVDLKSYNISYKCESIFALLIDSVMFGYHVVGNLGYYTSQVINYVLKGQSDFILKQCDFRHQYEYGWEQENKLNALFNIPSRFVSAYKWHLNSTVYPYEISLLNYNSENLPDHYLRTSLNLLNVTKKSDSTNLVTRIYPLGAGEGINQVNISKVTNGKYYIQAEQEYIEKYGLIETVWIDRRYTDEQSLLESAQKMLSELKEPYMEYSVDYVLLNAKKQVNVGDIVQIIDTESNDKFKTYITSIKYCHEEVPKIQLTLANKSSSIASTIADLADRQRIEEAYSQGATQIYAQSIQENASKDGGAVLDFYVPNDVSIINSVNCKIRCSQFRAYSKATDGGGGTTQTSSSGGSTSTTTGSGGGTYTSTGSGGSTNTTTGSGGGTYKSTGSGGGANFGQTTTQDNTNQIWRIGSAYENSEAITGVRGASGQSVPSHHHNIYDHNHSHSHSVTVTVPNHTHSIDIPTHTHSITIGTHTHSISIGTHTHSITIGTHTHNITLPNHTHNISAGIYRFGNARSFKLYVADRLVTTFTSTSLEIDITQYLVTSNGMIPRGQWLDVEVIPDDLSYISITLSFQGYIQSRGNLTV